MVYVFEAILYSYSQIVVNSNINASYSCAIKIPISELLCLQIVPE